MSGEVKGQSIVPVLAGGLGAGVLPRTGMNTATQIALAIAVGLAVWALAYMAMSKFSKR
jgi:hypothetical protein